MLNPSLVILIFLVAATTLSACSRRTSRVTGTSSTKTIPAASKPVKKATVKTAVPNVIVVNDAVARKSIDGRYYYDLEGHRYWRNNRDGRYYLFHKSMFDNPDFKAPGN